MHAFSHLMVSPDRPKRVARILGSLLVIAILFSATLHNEVLYGLFGLFWQKLFRLTGTSQHMPTLLQSDGIVGQVAHRSRDILAVLSYSVFYVGTCLVLLFLLLPDAAQRRMVVLFYCFTCIISLCLFVLGGAFNGGVLMTLNSRLIHFIVSPLPAIILVPLLRWYLPSNYP